MAIKVTPSDRSTGRSTVKVKTKADNMAVPRGANWWKAKLKAELASAVLDTAAYLKEQQQYRWRQASLQARMYGNMPLGTMAGSNLGKMNVNNSLPVDRPTMNVVQSCIDTLVSRIGQSKPKPTFLTDAADYKQRSLAKQLNNFVGGEFYQTNAYKLGEDVLRDAAVIGTGVIKIVEDDDAKVRLERTLATELLVDTNDAFYGTPRNMYQFKLVDRAVVSEMFAEERSKVQQAEQAYPDNNADSQKTMSDQIMLVEAWHLPSSKRAKDGRHVIACTSGILCDNDYDKQDFPFVFLHYSPRMVGFWAQGLAEQLTGTQVEINKLLSTISKSISLVGVPRVFVEDGSRVVKSHLNNEIGAIVTYRGTKPEYTVAPSVHPELYQQLQRLVDYAYQQSGISSLAATAQKPAGLNSGEAIRNYDDLQSDRFATLNKRYDDMYVKLAYKVIDLAKDIALRDGKYQTVYPNKDGTKEIDLPAAKLLDDPFVIQCFESSSLPRDPAGRLQKVTEMMQAGIIDMKEGRRLLSYPDIEQSDKLASAAQERIYKVLDEIVEDGKYTPPDPYTDIQAALQSVGQYYNLYVAAGLEEKKAEMLREWQTQVIMLQTAMQPPPMPGAAVGQDGQPIAVPEAPPVSSMLPQ